MVGSPFHVAATNEVTQFQFVGSVERIDTPCLAPVLEALLRAFPFNVRGFHTDNGSEFINHKIAARLQALHIDEFTKSRPRRSNVESKNGSVIRKHLGWVRLFLVGGKSSFWGGGKQRVLEGTRPRRGVVRRGGGGRVVSGRRGCLCRQRALGRSADGERQASRGHEAGPCG